MIAIVMYGNKSHSFYDLFFYVILIIVIFNSINFVSCEALNSSEYVADDYHVSAELRSSHRFIKRDIGRPCQNTSECADGMHCMMQKCRWCPDGFLPDRRGLRCYHPLKKKYFFQPTTFFNHLFIFIFILFLVMCFIHVTLVDRERRRQLFSQFLQPSRIPAAHYTQRRSSNLQPLRSYRSRTLGSPNHAHHVEISLHANGITSRLVEIHSNVSQGNSDSRDRDLFISLKEDPPPSYDEIMCRGVYKEDSPPPYKEL